MSLSSTYLLPRYWLTWVGITILRGIELLPYPVQRYAATAIGRLIQWIPPPSVRAARRNIGQRMRGLSTEAQEFLFEEHCRSLGMAICEMANACWRSDARVKHNAQVHGAGHLKAALGRGNGAILIGGRFTTAQIAARIIGTQTRLNVLYHGPRNALLGHVIMQRLSRYENLVAYDDYRGIVDALGRGEAIWYPFGEGTRRDDPVFTPSEGNSAAVGSPIVQLARSSGAAVLPCFAERLPGTRGYRIDMGAAFWEIPSSDETPVDEQLSTMIDIHIRRIPEQYSWS